VCRFSVNRYPIRNRAGNDHDSRPLPISPDGAADRDDNRTDEVIHARHGSLRRPRLHGSLNTKSPLTELLGQLQTVRADLPFREDGIHTILTIERKPPQK